MLTMRKVERDGRWRGKPGACALGHHYPEPRIADDGGVRRSCCRYCGSPIMRRESGSRWLFSGQLG